MARRRALVTTVAGSVAVLVLSSAPARADSEAYVALGDSYSAGTGAGRYLPDGTLCYRSVHSYPVLVAAARGYRLDLRACFGATVHDVREVQLSALEASTDRVTISVGGNDAGFLGVLVSCGLPAWASNCYASVDGARAYVRDVLTDDLRDLYADIRARAPRAEVTVVGYPRLWGRRGLQPADLLHGGRDDRAQPCRRPSRRHDQTARGGRRIHLCPGRSRVRRPRSVRRRSLAQRADPAHHRLLPPQSNRLLGRLRTGCRGRPQRTYGDGRHHPAGTSRDVRRSTRCRPAAPCSDRPDRRTTADAVPRPLVTGCASGSGTRRRRPLVTRQCRGRRPSLGCEAAAGEGCPGLRRRDRDPSSPLAPMDGSRDRSGDRMRPTHQHDARSTHCE
jgi:hypothetical protein